MARTKSIDSFEQKIEKAKETVDRAKVKYEAAIEELERLMTMREGLRKEQLINTITNSGKSFDEVMSFLEKYEVSAPMILAMGADDVLR